ncbi:hypothetical protein HWB51_gp055 [Mycobacterium phage Cuke]|uniref:Uncharacterized protein n=1 Tax=Mycobacterium phage Cuke TaxID=2079417 RepID=A0A2L1IX33_9CAUD|nr:hypothetical protein HWB51_gp055 [Mycobacterium phage Cuke]AVD99673.1 hypothetical protein SEA_CUKE_55 [Mycobacterium phage Cuke]
MNTPTLIEPDTYKAREEISKMAEEQGFSSFHIHGTHVIGYHDYNDCGGHEICRWWSS